MPTLTRLGRAAGLLAVAALALTAAPGCGGPTADLAAADAVQAGLEQWKTGQPPAALAARTPPVHFHDDDWQRGVRLLDFRLLPGTRGPDGAPRCAAVLSLAARGGRTWQREVVYQVKPGTPLVVARDPYS